MKVAILKSNAANIGGLENYTKRLAEAFGKKCEVTLLTTGSLCELPFEAISLCESSKFSLRHLKRFDALAQDWIANQRPDLIFGMERNSFQTHYRAGSGIHAAYLDRRKKIEGLRKRLSFALNPLHRHLLQVEKEAFEHPDLQKLFVNSQMVKEELLHYYNVAPNKVCVVHNGVDWENASAAKQNERYHYLFVGNDFRRKGLKEVLLGLRGMQNYQLTVVGRDRHAKSYMELAQKWQIRANFVGPSKQMNRFYEDADCLVLPTLYDPFANVTVEALAHGLFVITSPNNGGKEVLEEFSGVATEDVASAMMRAQQFERDPIAIRNSVKALTFENQLTRIVEQC
ncbi:MAG: hypothetical protein S4CHLAM81_09780 [Chlamydiales bacterium]|nr:hypothetical protein [Chlamydiales bacterium]MCH9635756.1 hypothetical protein [Chlamydiales bacterium]MCH9703210.1 glycosyltransferase family 4 protein [Chlamydiota bacterium]